MESSLIILFFIFFVVFVYFILIKPKKNWEKFIIYNGYNRQGSIDRNLKLKIEKLFNVLKYRSIFKKEEDDECTSWIIEIDSGCDNSPVLTYIVLSFSDHIFPNFFISNIKSKSDKLSNFWKTIYEKSIKASIFNDNLKLIDNGGDQIDLPTFAVFAEAKDKIDEFFSGDIKNIFKEWPTKTIEQIFIIDNLIIIHPKWFKKIKDWQYHLNSKDRLIKVIK